MVYEVLSLGVSVVGQPGLTTSVVCTEAFKIVCSLYGLWLLHQLDPFIRLQFPAKGSMSVEEVFPDQTSKCKCGPEELPELPTTPMNSPCVTVCPITFGVSEFFFICQYNVLEPSACWMTI